MVISSDRLLACPCARRPAVALAALTAGVALTGAMPAAAGAAQSHTANSRTYRILSVVKTSKDPKATRTTELQYDSPHDRRYLLTRRYTGSKLAHVFWLNQGVAGGPRSSISINIDAAHKTWIEREINLGRPPAPALGIQSSRQAIQRAIGDARAHPFGLTRMDGQRVRLLYLEPSAKHQMTTKLWVNAVTDQPVAENEAVTSGRHTFTVRSHWEKISHHALNQLRAKPSKPTGYTVTRPSPV